RTKMSERQKQNKFDLSFSPEVSPLKFPRPSRPRFPSYDRRNSHRRIFQLSTHAQFTRLRNCSRSGHSSRPGRKRQIPIHAKRNSSGQLGPLVRGIQPKPVQLHLLIAQLECPFSARPSRRAFGGFTRFRAQLHVPTAK